MKVTRSVAALAALSIGGAGVAGALPLTTYCNSGQALVTCASFQVVTAPNGSGGTLVQIFVRNEAGTLFLDTTGGSFITKIGLANNVGDYIAGTLLVTTSGTVGIVGSPDGLWTVATSAPELGTLEFLSETGNPAKEGAIQGCPVVSNPSEYFQTCGSLGQTGFVVIQFETDIAWDAADAIIAYKVQGAGGTADISLECITNPQDNKFNCGPPPPETPIPEPATMGLLATGLVALGGVGFFRRRKREQV